MSALALERALGDWLVRGLRTIGQIAIESGRDGTFILRHREDIGREGLAGHDTIQDAMGLARFDDAGNYRPLKTAPTLRHGWELKVENLAELRCVLDQFYPGRLAAFFAFGEGALVMTTLRDTLERQTGMYRIASQISDAQIDELVGSFCKSDGGCLRTILWRRDRDGALPSVKLPAEKFEPTQDQTGGQRPMIPLLCQEGCNLLVAAAREMVQAGQ